VGTTVAVEGRTTSCYTIGGVGTATTTGGGGGIGAS